MPGPHATPTPAHREPEQLELALPARKLRGGKRKGAGRKPVTPGRREHTRRPEHSRRHPLHVVLKVLRDVPRLRQRHLYAALREAFRGGAVRERFRMVQYSVQGNHLHLICEADDATSLSRGMQGLAIRMARRLNRALGRKGKVFADRYFADALKHPLRVRRALVYILNNFLRHERFTERLHGPVDPFSSAGHFEGWRSSLPPFVRRDAGPRVCAPAQTWLLTRGWVPLGRLRFGEAPAARL